MSRLTVAAGGAPGGEMEKCAGNHIRIQSIMFKYKQGKNTFDVTYNWKALRGGNKHMGAVVASGTWVADRAGEEYPDMKSDEMRDWVNGYPTDCSAMVFPSAINAMLDKPGDSIQLPNDANDKDDDLESNNTYFGPVTKDPTRAPGSHEAEGEAKEKELERGSVVWASWDQLPSLNSWQRTSSSAPTKHQRTESNTQPTTHPAANKAIQTSASRTDHAPAATTHPGGHWRPVHHTHKKDDIIDRNTTPRPLRRVPRDPLEEYRLSRCMSTEITAAARDAGRTPPTHIADALRAQGLEIQPTSIYRYKKDGRVVNQRPMGPVDRLDIEQTTRALDELATDIAAHATPADLGKCYWAYLQQQWWFDENGQHVPTVERRELRRRWPHVYQWEEVYSEGEGDESTQPSDRFKSSASEMSRVLHQWPLEQWIDEASDENKQYKFIRLSDIDPPDTLSIGKSPHMTRSATKKQAGAQWLGRRLATEKNPTTLCPTMPFIREEQSDDTLSSAPKLPLPILRGLAPRPARRTLFGRVNIDEEKDDP
ncbi:hypothetical protein F5Y18DRAFT_429474 [Xylariaceae sp. FL1019]|nr:hypothetical protein F5Y18DRAFT_429474 [Xylariaceae sp. FL1019]